MSEVKERRKPETVVTSENLAAYQEKQYERMAPISTKAKEPVKEPDKEAPKEPGVEAAPVVEAKPEPVAKTEAEPKEPKPEAKVEKKEAKEADDDEPDRAKKKINERMHELAEKAKSERTKREEVERRLAEVEARLTPPAVKVDETPKPKRDDFTDAFDYAEKLSEWNVKNALQERDKAEAKARQDAREASVRDTWNQRVETLKKEVPDFAEKISTSTIVVSNEVRDAIYESDIGPQILLHLAEHPDEAEKIGRMTVGKAYIALGKLEAILAVPKPVEKEEKDEVKPVPKAKPIEVSKAPAPISPLKGANAPADLPIVDGVWRGTHEEYREARRSGKIK